LLDSPFLSVLEAFCNGREPQKKGCPTGRLDSSLLILLFSLNLPLRRWVCGKAAGGGQTGGRASFCPSTGLSTPLSRVPARLHRAGFPHIHGPQLKAAGMPPEWVAGGTPAPFGRGRRKTPPRLAAVGGHGAAAGVQ